MARIKGVDIPNNKRVEIALTYIYGVGRSLSNKILNDAKIDVNKKNLYHETEKPVELIEYLIQLFSMKNQVILDFTMGSGTTGVACVNNNRKFIGIELDEHYYNIACQRVGDATC